MPSGGARYSKDGNLLTIRKPSKDPAVKFFVSVPTSLFKRLEEYAMQEYGNQRSRTIQSALYEFLEARGY